MMKKIFMLFVFLAGSMYFFPMSASASCQDIRFSDGGRFCFDIKKINSSTFEAQVSGKSTSSSISCNLTLPDNRSVSLSNCEGRFNYDGNDVGGIYLRAVGRTTYDLLTNYDFRNGTFDSNYSSSSYYSDYYVEISSVSDSRPDTDEWIDVTLKVKRSGSTYDYNGNIDFYVEGYNGGSWSRASSYQYDLDKSTYSFSRSDWGEVRLYNLLRFRESGEYRLVAELRGNGEKAYETFYVDGYYHNNNSYSSSDARELSVYSMSPSKPSTYEWVDVTIRAVTNNGNIASNYNKRVKIEVQQYRNGSWRTAEFSDYDLNTESYTFSSSDDGRKTFNSLVRFRRTGEYRLKFTEDYDSSVYGTKTITVDSDSNYNSYYNGYSSSYNAKELSVYSISTSNPSTYQWINVTLKAVANNGSTANNYDKRVRIEVQEYRNGYWRSASSSDYDLDKTSYTFSRSDNGTKTFNSLVRFRSTGEYRLKFTEDNDSSVYGTRTINVGSSNSYSYSYSSSYNAKELSVYSVSSTNPSTNQWVSVTLRALTNNGSVASNYNKRVRIEVQEYRNGYWRSANSSDYDLDRTTYTFSTSDNGSKTFNSLVRFRTNGEFRLKFTENNDSSVYGTRTIYVGSSYYNNYYRYNDDYRYYDGYRYYDSYGDFTDSELKKIRAVYDIWDNVISSLQRDYPKLRNSSSWKSRSDTFQRNMKDVLSNSRSSSFRNWSDFYEGFMNWLRYTTETR